MISNEHKLFVKKEKQKRLMIKVIQISILFIFIISWELLSKYNLINSFITSSPSNIIKTIINLYNQNNLFIHIITTIKEVLISFTFTTIISLLIATLLYSFPIIAKILDPYLTILNSLPKVALGPLIIITLGANQKSIITMSILIAFITSIQTIYTGFIKTDKNKIKFMKSINASKKEILFNLIIPSNKETIISSLKINISLCLIGVIQGEFLTSKAGLGYLIIYGTQIFNLNLVMTSIIILTIISYIMYIIINNKKSRNF